MKKNRAVLAGVLFVAFALILLYSFYSIYVNPGLNLVYNMFGVDMAPNMVTLIVFDWRGFDTLGECFILVCGVLAVSLLFGRGLIRDSEAPANPPAGADVKPTLILQYFTSTLIVLIMAYGIYTALGGHITPGGGFQGGSLIASGVMLSLVVYGRKHLVSLSQSFLIKLETAGLLIYLLLGLCGLIFSGYYLYNLGINFYHLVPSEVETIFNYPDAVHAGILPYLNIAVMLKVSAGLSTILLVLLEVKEHD